MAAARHSAVFDLTEVTCEFGSLKAVDGATLRIENAERVALIGPSGSGKTTLLRMLNTVRAPDGGAVSVFGKNIAELGVPALRELRARIGFIPQHLGLVPNLSVLQNVILGAGGKRGTLRSLRDLVFPDRSDLREIHRILERVGIEEKLYSRTDTLSGGQQQRVAIARALYQNPDALLADEPVASVDPTRARDTVSLLCELSEEKGFALCVSLHNLELARDFFPRVIGLRKGRIEFDSAPEELRDSEFESLYEIEAGEMMNDA